MRAALLLLAAALPACSALQVTYEPCDQDAQCREAFGRGWGCEEASGHCVEVPADARCRSYPEGILDDLPANEDRLLIGSVFDQTDFDLMVKAARLAVFQVNDRGGLGGVDLGIIECTNRPADPTDGAAFDQNSVETGLYLTDALGISTIVGPATSGRTLNAYNAWSKRGTLLISPSATSPELTTIDGTSSTDEAPGLLWRTASPDSLQGRVIARELIEVEHRNDVAVVAQIGPYGDGLTEVFMEHFPGQGRTAQRFPFESATDLAGAVTTVASGGFDAVLVISSSASDIVGFLNAAANLGPQSAYTDMTIFLPDAARTVQVVNDTTPAARDLLFPQVRGTGPSSPDGPAFHNFTSQFGLLFEEDPTNFVFSAHAYDAAWLALAGLSWSQANEGGISGLGGARGLRRVSDPDFIDPTTGEPDLEIGPGAWTAVQSFFSEGRSINLQGASGSLDFDPDSGETTAPVDVWEFQDGQEAVLYCIDLSPEPRADCCATPTECNPT